jgi:hypothetical protein
MLAQARLAQLGVREHQEHHVDSLHPAARDYILLKIKRRVA